MKIRVTMKTPDALDDAIKEVVDDMSFDYSEDNETRAFAKEQRKNQLEEIAEQWFKYGEYLTIEIDTVNNTCTVLKK